MEIRDVIHGSISIDRHELPILDSRYFQRLRQIKQLGFAEYSYPSALHNRYIHSLGAMEAATRAFDVIFTQGKASHLIPLPHTTHSRFRAVVRLAALLHDIGHGPLSHTSEFSMPPVQELQLPPLLPIRDTQATHEDYTLKLILDSGLTPLLEKAGAEHGFTSHHIAGLIEPRIPLTDNFFIERINDVRVDFRPILQQLISSELDADRMDYLRRDSFHAGVSYGHFDFDWLVRNLTAYIHNHQCFLALQHRALYAFEDFLISRFHMFLMVYFHYKSVVYDSMLAQYFLSKDCEYRLPTDIEKYGEFTDAHLISHLAKSSNTWAQRITHQNPYRMLIELHSGIPTTKLATIEQEKLIAQLKDELDTRKIHYLVATSTGELSKYFRKPGNPIYMKYDNHYSAPTFIPLEQCTDLFQKYSEKRVITRLYIAPEHYSECRHLGRELPLNF